MKIGTIGKEKINVDFWQLVWLYMGLMIASWVLIAILYTIIIVGLSLLGV